jgi:hypothetical protein
MPEEKKGTLSEAVRWAIAPEWFELNGRSFQAFVKGYLCSTCAKRLTEKKQPTMKNVLAAIQSCCSQAPEFFTEKLPVLETTFRLFLRNGNTPLTITQLSSELAKLCTGDIYRTAPEALTHVLANDQFYGIHQFPA